VSLLPTHSLGVTRIVDGRSGPRLPIAIDVSDPILAAGEEASVSSELRPEASSPAPPYFRRSPSGNLYSNTTAEGTDIFSALAGSIALRKESLKAL
jgi:hypothetical protein